MRAIAVFNYNRGSIDIIQNVPSIMDLPPMYGEDYDMWLKDLFEYNLDEIEWMIIEIDPGEPLPIYLLN